MRTFQCECGQTLFFHSVQCLACKRKVGMCTTCNQVSAINENESGEMHCGVNDCGATITRCSNSSQGFCNRYPPAQNNADVMCDYCATTNLIPDLSINGNLAAWKKLETAKQRVLYVLDMIRLPFRPAPDAHVLRFEFKADNQQAIYTGHFDGCITINIREADSVERERTRVEFSEPQRTLVGHIRHELGHYYWDRLVRGRDEEAFRTIFGDERNPSYEEALKQHHNDSLPKNWPANYVSAYAAMHPWEDFAETFGAYLDMVSVLDTAQSFQIASRELESLDQMVKQYQQVGMVANELNRDMGLIDLVPEVFTSGVVKKLDYVHGLVAAERDRGQ